MTAIVIVLAVIVLAALIVSMKDNPEDVVIQRLSRAAKNDRIVMAAPRIYTSAKKGHN